MYVYQIDKDIKINKLERDIKILQIGKLNQTQIQLIRTIFKYEINIDLDQIIFHRTELPQSV